MPASAPKVSVIIPAYNCEKYVAAAIESVLAQTFSDFEIIVVNDGSTDGTSAVLDRFGDRITVINQENKNVAEARNTGVRAAKGELLALLDSDDLWLPGKLERQVPLFDNPAVGCVYSNCGYFFEGSKTIGDSFSLSPPARGRVVDRLLMGNFVCVSSAVVRRSLLEGMELFRSAFILCEDYDVFLRLSAVCEFEYVDEELVLYRVHPDNASRARTVMWRRVVGVVEDFAASHPEIEKEFPGALRRARLNSIKILGYGHLAEGNFPEARKWYREYCAGYPFDMKRRAICLLTYFGKAPFKALGIYGKDMFASQDAHAKRFGG